ncbi:MAG: hypothetical protein BWY11_02328 [Firmicutes bacterium ADurb.Bin182]|nr:MAG: hypothetical protein BWY11_02328 [Firmicutes bacterium ADurb.Bin182]
MDRPSFPVSEQHPCFRLSFEANQACFILHASDNGEPVSLRKAMDSLPFRLIPPVPLFTNSDSVNIRPAYFEQVRAWMFKCSIQIEKKIAAFELDAFVKRVDITEPPGWFRISFVREGGALLFKPQNEVISLGDGWFLCGEQMWKSGLEASHAQYIGNIIEGAALVAFLRDVLPEWSKKGVAYDCPLVYLDEPLNKIRIINAGENTVEIELRDECADAVRIRETEDFAVCCGAVRPKLSGELFNRFFSSGQRRVLEGDDIADFVLAAKGVWAPFIQGDLSLLIRMHDVFDKAELKLQAYPELKKGVGRPYARAVLQAGGKEYDPAKVSRSISSSGYVRLDHGFVPVSLLNSAGLGRMGRTSDGMPLDKPYPLKDEELFRRGSDRLKGPWTHMEIIDFGYGEAQERRSFHHLAFLAKWGVSGGLLGGVERNMQDTVEFLSGLQTAAPDCRVLIVGKKALLKEIDSYLARLRPYILPEDAFAYLHPGGIRVISSGELEKSDQVLSAAFDLLILLEPDNMTKTEVSKTFRDLYRIKARLRIALYSENAYKLTERHEEIQRSLLRIPNKFIGMFSVIDPDRQFPRLPRPHSFRPYYNFEKQNFASVKIPGALHSKGVSIPKRPVFSHTGTAGIPPGRPVFESPEPRFIRMAHELADRSLDFAEFVPFMTYWPTYDRMTQEQTQWYIYWRSEVRNQRYPKTDLSYIFLYIYELLNLVGCETKRQGYDRLMAVWRAYRQTYPKLDEYLVNWMVDFIFLYEIDVSVQEILSLSGNNITGDLLDMELYRRLSAEPVDIGISMLSRASNYDIRQSRFYQSVDSAEIDLCLPKVIALVDSYLKKRHGQRIIEMFNPGRLVRTRSVFRSAVYTGTVREIKLTVAPLSTHAPLRDFLAQVIRCAENKLRDIKGASGKLRGVDLELDIQKLIELYLEREFTEKPEPVKVTLDRDKLARIAKESDMTREMLTVQGFDEPEETGFPYGAEANLHKTGPSSLKELVQSLSIDESRLLTHLFESGWEVSGSELGSESGFFAELAVNSVNEKALDMLKRLLIVEEGHKILVDEDFRDELQMLLGEKRENEAAFSGLAELGGGWKSFVENLPPELLEILRAVYFNNAGELQRLADKSGVMTQIMVDSVNEAAMETLNDIIITDMRIEDEYVPVLGKIFDRQERLNERI